MPKRKVGEILKFNFTIPLWLIVSSITIINILIYLILAQYREEIKFISTVIGGAAAIYSAYYVGEALRMKIDRDKQQASFDILSQLNSPEFVSVINFIKNNVESHETISETQLYTAISSDINLSDAVITVLGTLEDTSIAIQHEFADEEILYLSISTLALRNYRGLRGYIEQSRKLTNTAEYYKEFEKLAKAWIDNNRLSDGRKILCRDNVIA